MSEEEISPAGFRSSDSELGTGVGIDLDADLEGEDILGGFDEDVLRFSRYDPNTGMDSGRYGDLTKSYYDHENENSGIAGWGIDEADYSEDVYNFDLGGNSDKKKKKKKKKAKRDKEKEKVERLARERELRKSKDQRLEELLGQVSSERKAAKLAMQKEIEEKEKKEKEDQRKEIEAIKQAETPDENEHDGSRFANDSVTSDSLNLSSTDFEVGGYRRKLNEEELETELGTLDSKAVYEKQMDDVEAQEFGDTSKPDMSREHSGLFEDGMLKSNKTYENGNSAELSKKEIIKRKLSAIGEEGLEKAAIEHNFSFAEISEFMQKSPISEKESINSNRTQGTPTSSLSNKSYIDEDENTRDFNESTVFVGKSSGNHRGRYREGDQVEVKIPEWQNSYWGVIERCNEDDTYTIFFDDGERHHDIKDDEILAVSGYQEHGSSSLRSNGSRNHNNQERFSSPRSPDGGGYSDDFDTEHETQHVHNFAENGINNDDNMSRPTTSKSHENESVGDYNTSQNMTNPPEIEVSNDNEMSLATLPTKDDIVGEAEYQKLAQNFRYGEDSEDNTAIEGVRSNTPVEEIDPNNSFNELNRVKPAASETVDSETIHDEKSNDISRLSNQEVNERENISKRSNSDCEIQKSRIPKPKILTPEKHYKDPKRRFWEGMKMTKGQNEVMNSPPPPPPPNSSSKAASILLNEKEGVQRSDENEFYYLSEFPPPPPPSLAEGCEHEHTTGKVKIINPGKKAEINITSPANRYAAINDSRTLSKDEKMGVRVRTKSHEANLRKSLRLEYKNNRDIQYLQSALSKAAIREESLLGQLEQQKADAAEAWRRCSSLETHVETLKAECFSLENALEELKSSNPARLSLNLIENSRGENNEGVNKVALSKIQKELEEQERLLEGYQKENEKLVEQLREAEKSKTELKKKMLLQHQKHGMEINKNDSPYKQNSRHSTADELRKQLGLESEIERLKEDLKDEKNRNKLKQEELKNELDKVRRDKRDLECKLGGMKGVEELEDQNKRQESLNYVSTVDKLRKELAEARLEHLTEAKMLKEKLKWYAENQDILDANDKLIAEQREIIKNLKLDMGNRSSGGNANVNSHTSNRNRSLPSDLKRIHSLEKQVKELEEALRKRNPDCLANLIRAAGPSEEELKVQRDLKLKVSLLEEEIKERDAEANKRVRALRQEHEKIKIKYETLLQSKTGEQKNNGEVSHSNSGKNESKIHALEQELSRVRNFYRKKLEENSKKHDLAMRNARKGDTAVGNVSIASLHRESDKLRGEKAVLEARVEELETLLGGRHTSNNSKVNTEIERLKTTLKTLREENDNLKRKTEETKVDSAVGANEEEEDNYIKEQKPLSLLDAVEAVDNNKINTFNASEVKVTMKELRQRLHDSEVARKAVERLLLDAKVKGYTSEEPGVDKENRNVVGNTIGNKTPGANVEELGKLLVKSEESFNKLFKENMELQAQLADYKAQLLVPQTPSMLHHQSLLRRIEQMEYRHNNRERELERIVQQVKQRAELDIQLARANFQNVLTQKNAEIKRFQIELDALMEDVKNLI